VAPKPSVWQKRTRAIFKSAFAKALSFFHAVYRKLSWENLQAAVNASASNAIKLVWIATSILVVGFVVRDLSTDLVTIEPISVPKLFSENGYTPEVASRRLRDAVNDYAAKAGTWMKSPSIAPRDELPNIIVPKIDLSLDTVVSSIRNLLHYGNRRSISGELVLRKNAVWLNLRVDGQRVYSSPSGFDSENPDELLAAAVPALVEQIRPYLVASTLYNDDPARGAQKADDIIARFLVSDVNVLWAHILKGQFLIEEKKDYLQAETVLRRAISLDKANPVAHNNLGLTLNFQGKHDEAMAEYQYAIKLDSKYALPHYNLGNILSACPGTS
jgi:tetratricopeptide (TPR) repeat protein